MLSEYKGLSSLKTYKWSLRNAIEYITQAVAKMYSVKKIYLKKFAKFTRKQLCQSLFFNEVAGLSLQ